MSEYLARVAKVQAEILAKREAEATNAPTYELPIIFDDSPTGLPPPEIVQPNYDNQSASSPGSVWQPISARTNFAEPSRAKEYQFDSANALIVALIITAAGAIWFARRRLMWLARHAYSNLRVFIRWLHMPPDDKI